MILQLLIQMVIALFNTLTSFFPVVTVLPMGIDSILVQGMGYFWFINTVFPPFAVLFDAMMFVIIFKLSLKGIAMLPIIKNILYKPS